MACTAAVTCLQMAKEAELNREQDRRRAEKYSKILKIYLEQVKSIEGVVVESAAAKHASVLYDRLQSWIGAPTSLHLRTAHDDAQKLRDAGTAEWVFKSDEFLAWNRSTASSDSDNPYENFLFVTGNPGSGKTVLASSSLDWMRSSENSVYENCGIGHYFFSYRSAPTRSRVLAYATILSQILDQYRDCKQIIDIFSFPLTDEMYSVKSLKANAKASASDLLDLLTFVARRLANLVVMLDGLDESDEPETIITDISRAFEGTNSKIIIFTRPNVQLLTSVAGFRRIAITRNKVERDIQTYLSRRLNNFRSRRLLTQVDDLEGLVDHLLQASNGMFLWSRLMMDYISSPSLNRQSRLDALYSVSRHETLDEMWFRILKHIAGKIEPERRMASRLFSWIIWAAHPLSPCQMLDVIHYHTSPTNMGGQGESSYPSDADVLEFREAVPLISASLVEESQDSDSFRFIHKSVADFLKTFSTQPHHQKSDVDIFACPEAQTNDQLAAECLTYLLNRLPTQPLSGDMRLNVSRIQIVKTNAFLEYATTYWIHHLSGSLAKGNTGAATNPERACEVLERLLANKLRVMAWLEAQYLLVSDAAIRRLLIQLKLYAAKSQELPDGESSGYEGSCSLLSRLEQMYTDLATLHDDWSTSLHKNPHYIWNDVTAFTRGHLWMATSAVSVSSLATTSFDPACGSKSLMTISKESHCGRFMGVFSIWPDRSFEQFLLNSRSVDVARVPCDNWKARYEVWGIDTASPQKIHDFSIALDSGEVKAQVAQTMSQRGSWQTRRPGNRRTRLEPTFKWSLSFPAAIGGDLNTIVVLRTAYALLRRPGTQSEEMFLCQIPLPGGDQRLPVSPTTNPEPSQTDSYAGRSSNLSSLRSVELYNHLIGHNGRYVVRQHSRALLVGNVTDPVTHTLVAYDLHPDRGEATILDCYRDSQMGGSIRACCLHPELPLAVFYFRQICSAPRMRLWYFGPRRQGSTSVTVELTPTIPLRATSVIDALHFSACGKQIVVQTTGSLPMVIQLESYELYGLAVANAASVQPPSGGGARPPDLATVSRSEGNDLVAFTKRAHGGQLVLDGDSAMKARVSLRGGSRSVELTRTSMSDPTTRETQQILALPDSWTRTGCSGANPSISLGSSSDPQKENNIRVVLNRTAQPWYSYSDPAEENLPAVVFKDARALLPPVAASGAAAIGPRTGRSRAAKRPVSAAGLDGAEPSSGRRVRATLPRAEEDSPPLKEEEGSPPAAIVLGASASSAIVVDSD
ncbi:hypothetical protein GGR56DRAFT_191479 [Xylariaceae sp. FL0804]|nr:hypothetical protein GGR56DRAFT_191479 [Xylariaceae sp. FL0804]